MTQKLLIVFAAACVPLLSQTNTGRILGSVYDKSQAVVANAAVTIVDSERGTTRNLTTNESGEYTATNLQPGVYTVRAVATGFKNVERRNIALEVASDARVDFTLEPGETQSTITVSSEAVLIDTTSAVLGGTLSNQTINDLPINGRNFFQLTQIVPGAQVVEDLPFGQ